MYKYIGYKNFFRILRIIYFKGYFYYFNIFYMICMLLYYFEF